MRPSASGHDREGPAAAEEAGIRAQPPMSTWPTATTVPTGRSTGSLQVLAVSPARAAALPLIVTVALPLMIVALFVGGFTNVPPIGMCDGVLVAVLSTVAAAAPPILTSLLTRAVDDPAERMRHRDRRGRPRRLDQVDVQRHDPIALCALPAVP